MTRLCTLLHIHLAGAGCEPLQLIRSEHRSEVPTKLTQPALPKPPSGSPIGAEQSVLVAPNLPINLPVPPSSACV